MRDEHLLGMSLDDAKKLAKENGVALRAVSVDGQPQVGTADYRRDRINIHVEKGMVTMIKGRG